MAFTVMQVLEKLLRDVTNLQKENSEINLSWTHQTHMYVDLHLCCELPGYVKINEHVL